MVGGRGGVGEWWLVPSGSNRQSDRAEPRDSCCNLLHTPNQTHPRTKPPPTPTSQTFRDPAALEAALTTFRATDALFHDAETGGYDESHSLPFLHKVRLEGGGMPRTLNIFLHGTGEIE
jgi:hypothetical protein